MRWVNRDPPGHTERTLGGRHGRRERDGQGDGERDRVGGKVKGKGGGMSEK